MFEEHPGGVGEVCGLRAAEFGWKILDDVVEGGVGLASGEEFEEVIAEGVVGVGSFFLGGHWFLGDLFAGGDEFSLALFWRGKSGARISSASIGNNSHVSQK